MKNKLRQIMLSKRKALSSSYKEAASLSIQEQVLSSSLFIKANTIFTYINTPDEPSTIKIIETALDSGKAVYVPKCMEGNMFAVRIYNLKNLVKGKLGILEPREPHSSDDIDYDDWLIIVPCLSAFLDGRRLGHGAGYYDRFLAGCGKNTVCLCFREMLCPDIPMMEHDVYMSWVVTEKESPAH